MSKKEKRFIKVHTETCGFSGPATNILVDRLTGVNYLYASGGYGGGLTVLVDANGQPVVTPLRELKTED